MKDARILEHGGIPERHHPIYRGKQEVEEARYLTDAFRAEAVSFINGTAASPSFFISRRTRSMRRYRPTIATGTGSLA